MTNDVAEFPARDGEAHRRLCFRYAALSTPAQKAAFFAKYGARWTEFARLTYFDLVRWTVVDPMHNLLLGVAKTQWYTQWIKTNTLRADTDNYTRELTFIHNFMKTYESPPWAGRLPTRVGEPAGGSLTADEYKFAVTGPWAIIVNSPQLKIPIVWERFLPEATDDYEKARRRYEHRKNPTDADPEPSPRMVEEEDENFLRFAAALKLILYGPGEMKPNHHWAVHVPDQLLDYGPVYNFWAFLTERLNKLLKNLNSNNWTGGALEVSMMREFHRNGAVDSKVCLVLPCPTKTILTIP
ncbi:hypothetical protein C8F04DRAFT_965686 [Mycena alexandri]|uniref:Uncharacterized protein n=1 Tax=Mycena alexandri TaxID=1745969 RepID=A0AAD6SFM1_9AGAR|nr:hypothetical protein C8F04DRAFT_965686 [Mycena alexandri]